MGHTIKLAVVGAVAFMVLDGIWLGLLMKNFYRDQWRRSPVSSTAGLPQLAGGVRRLHPARRRHCPLRHPAGIDGLVRGCYGALLGLVVYGVYDFTNYSTLRQWPFVLTLADTAWGALATALAAAAVRIVAR
jgi:uncharacterized membrane protein